MLKLKCPVAAAIVRPGGAAEPSSSRIMSVLGYHTRALSAVKMPLFAAKRPRSSIHWGLGAPQQNGQENPAVSLRMFKAQNQLEAAFGSGTGLSDSVRR
jgi:hypothetical protein